MTVANPIDSARAHALRSLLDAESPLLGGEWLQTQEARKQEEAEFHDRDRADHADEKGTSRQQNRRFYRVAGKVDDAIAHWMKANAPGKIVLDFACGHGNQTLGAADAGASLAVGIDISSVSVNNAIERSVNRGVADRTRFLQRDCEATGFPDESFDLVLCSGVLHHMDLAKAYPEMHRITRTGGRILCVEALGHNPIIQRFRDRTPHLRTAWEKDHILKMRDLTLAKRWFRVENVTFYNLFAPAALLLPTEALRAIAVPIADSLDLIATRIPGVRLLSWMFTFELVKT